MRNHLSIVVLACVASGCVIDADHVSTRLYAVCTREVPLLFTQASTGVAVASVAVEDVGAMVDDPDARASLDTLVLEARTGISDFSFASSLRATVLAPGSSLPAALVAELSPVSGESPMTAAGDRSINLVDYLSADSLAVQIELFGTAPNDTFSALLEACLEVDGVEIE
jgi:hypothetical protein